MPRRAPQDVSELLAAAGPAPGGPLTGRVTYDAPCHLLHAHRVVAPPLAVLGAIPGLELIPLTESDQCCGGAGIYNLLEPETSALVLGRKIAHIREAFEIAADGSPEGPARANGSSTRSASDELHQHGSDRGEAWVATGNPGCHMQIGAGMRLGHIPIRVTHSVELLEASYAARQP